MNVTSPPGVARLPMYPFRYNRSRHSTSNVDLPPGLRQTVKRLVTVRW
jgi:hypothetical protein